MTGATASVDRKTDELLETIKKLPGYVFELSADLGSGRNFSIRGNFGVDTGLDVMNVEMDKLVRVCDRQQARACISAIEEEIFKLERMQEKSVKDFNAGEARRKGHKSLPATEEANRENQRTTIEELKALIDRKKNLLQKTRKEAE